MKKRGAAAALRFAKALLEFSETHNRVDTVHQELLEISRSVENVPFFWAFMSHPIIPVQRKKEVIEEMFSTRYSSVLVSFLNLLIERKTMDLLPNIINAFRRILRQRAHQEEVYIETAQPFSNSMAHALQEKLAAVLQKSIVVEVATNPALVGGWKLRIGDQAVDASLDGRLTMLRDYWKKADISSMLPKEVHG